MKHVIIILCFVLFSHIQCQEIKEATEVFLDAKSNCDCEEDENDKFEDVYDDSMFFNKLESTKDSGLDVQPRVSLNCFGLPGKFASIMEKFLKNDANGTKALKVDFHYRSRKQPKRALLQCGESFSLAGTDFDITKRTVFIVHGFFATGEEEWIIDMENALLTWDDLNIFTVDWSDGSNTWNYFKAAFNTKTVGDQIATFINQIFADVTSFDCVDPSDWGPLHLIGHSLGAHICGYASHELKRRGNYWPVYRITGLDPAQPCFRKSDLSLRLDTSDAHFVDVIHTNGRFLKQMGLGLPYPLGHIDFYPNGGSIQPGCILTQSSFWKYLPLPINTIKKTICSHGRSQLYFTESIYTAVTKNCTFWAYKWDMSYDDLESLLSNQCDADDQHHNCVEMGINAEKYIQNGTFFGITGSSSPYCSFNKSIDEMVKEIERKITRLNVK